MKFALSDEQISLRDAARAFLAELPGPHAMTEQDGAYNADAWSRIVGEQGWTSILIPADQTTFLLDPDIPTDSSKLRPLTNLPGLARWESSTLRIEPATPEPVIHLILGTHTLTATDPRTGVVQTLTLQVKSL
jgi:hypothetical protein